MARSRFESDGGGHMRKMNKDGKLMEKGMEEEGIEEDG